MAEESPVQKQQKRMGDIQKDLQSVSDARRKLSEAVGVREDLIGEMREHLGAFARAAGTLATLAANEHSALYKELQEKTKAALARGGEAGIVEESTNADAKAAISHADASNDEIDLALILLAAIAVGAEGLQTSTNVLGIIEPLWAANSALMTANVSICYGAEVAAREAETYKGEL